MAYQVSSGGTEESVLHVLDVATGELVDGPIDRARYSPVAWLPGGEAFYYVRRLPPEELPQDEAQYHRRIWLHRLGTPATDDVEVFGAGLDHTNYYGVSVSRDGRWLIVSASAGTAPRTDVWIADLTASGPATPSFVDVAVGLDAADGRVGGAGRPAVRAHRPGRAPRTDRGHGSHRAGRRALDDPAGRGPDGRPGGRRVHRRRRRGHDTDPAAGVLAPALGVRGQRARPAHRRAPPRRVHASRARLDLRPRDAPRRRSGGLVLLRRPHDAVERAPVRRPHRHDDACGRRPPGSSPTCPTSAPSRSRSPASTARRSGRSSSRGPTPSTPPDGRWRPPRRSSTGTAGSRSRSTPRSPRRPSRGSRRAACTSSPTCAAAARRASSGTARGCARTSRTCSTTSTPSATTSSRRAGRRRSSWPAGAARTVACWWARP